MGKESDERERNEKEGVGRGRGEWGMEVGFGGKC